MVTVNWRETIAGRIERNNLLANSTILMLCLVYVLPNIWGVRTWYYVVVLPLFLLSVGKAAFAAVVRAPVFLAAAAYLLSFVVAAPFAPDFDTKPLFEHIRHSLLILSFLMVVGVVTRADREFPFRLFASVSAIAALAAVLNICVHYDGLPDFSPEMGRLGGVTGQTIYYNPNFVALSYGFPCVGAAAAIRPGTSRPLATLLVVSALVLLVAVVLTGTRSVLIGVVIGLAVLVALLSPKFGTPTRGMVYSLAALIVAAAATRYGESLLARGDSFRLFLWKSYFSYVEAHPWAGWGVSARLPVVLPDGTEHVHPHNMIYHAVLHGGVFAGVALTALFAVVIVTAALSWKRTRSPFLLALVVAAFIPLLMDFNFLAGSVGLDWVTLWLPVGLTLGASLRDDAPSDRSAPPRTT